MSLLPTPPPTLAGIHAALWTPTDEAGTPLETAIKEHLQFLGRTGVRGVLALGSTGNFARMDVRTRQKTLDLVMKHRGGLEVWANISDLRPSAVIELGRQALGAGALGVTILPPWFYPMRDVDVAEFFVRIAERLGSSIILYNFLELTGKRLTPAVVDEVAAQVEVRGLKQSGDAFERHPEMIECAKRHGFPVLTGWDTRVGEALDMGAAGCIGGLTNFAPELLVEAERAHQEKDMSAKTVVAEKLQALGRACQTLPFPLNIAAGMEARGLTAGAPKMDCSAETARDYQELVGQLRRLFSEWGMI